MGMSAPPRRNAFGDPATGFVYPWHRNHEEEQGGARIRSIDNSQPTIGRWRTVRAVRMQGSRDEMIYKLAGKVPTLAQHEMFLYFSAVSLERTIYFFHAAGDVFECQLSDYEPQREYTGGGKGEREDYLWLYSLQLDVIQMLNAPIDT